MYTLIESIEDLTVLNNELLSKDYVGIDTEFRRTTKDNMRLSLLQVNDGEEIYLIDAIKISDPSNKCSFLYSEGVTKIIHSCKEDIEAIFTWTKQKIYNVFDTQIAHSFLEDEYSISYQSLVQKKLDIALEKKETRSNWLKRPLSDAQLKYAALDVEYLMHIYLVQLKDLTETKKLDWHNQDVKKLIDTDFQIPALGLKRIISKDQEEEILKKFNEIVIEKAMEEGISKTLFFSKKAQKDFLRSAISNGLNSAYQGITKWRKELIHDDITQILK